jgi:hypothetical protein
MRGRARANSDRSELETAAGHAASVSTMHRACSVTVRHSRSRPAGCVGGACPAAYGSRNGRDTVARYPDGVYQVRSAHPEPTGTASFPQGGPEHGYTAVASAIRRRGGPTVSHTYLWQLRRGLRDNPTKQHLEALADFFGVPPSYFFDDAAGPRPEADLELLAAFVDQLVVATRLIDAHRARVSRQGT